MQTALQTKLQLEHIAGLPHYPQPDLGKSLTAAVTGWGVGVPTHNPQKTTGQGFHGKQLQMHRMFGRTHIMVWFRTQSLMERVNIPIICVAQTLHDPCHTSGEMELGKGHQAGRLPAHQCPYQDVTGSQMELAHSVVVDL